MPNLIVESTLYNPLRMFPSKESLNPHQKNFVFRNRAVANQRTIINSTPMQIGMNTRLKQSSTHFVSFTGEPEIIAQDYDDFSITSREAESIADDDFCFESIHNDPASFWDQGIVVSNMKTGRVSPANVTIASGGSSEPMQIQDSQPKATKASR